MPSRAAELKSELRQEDINVNVESEIEQLCRTSDVIVTTTPSRHPIVNSEWIRPGTHITALGADAPGKQELDVEIVRRANLIVVDSLQQCADHGEIATAVTEGLLDPEECVEFGNLLAGKAVGRGSPFDITVADLTGMATQDIAIVRAALAAVGNRGRRAGKNICATPP